MREEYDANRKAIKEAITNLKELVEEATSSLKYRERKSTGRPNKLTLEQRTLLLLIKEIFNMSNRMMESFLMMFSLFLGIEVSYKTIERLYRDEEVMLVLHNLSILLVKRKEIKDVDRASRRWQ